MTKRRNALLAEPPESVHALTGSGGQHFRSVVGRPTTAEDYHGVHTTGSKEIAGVYADYGDTVLCQQR